MGARSYAPPAEEKPKVRVNPLVAPNTLYPRAVKGGSWDDGANSHRGCPNGFGGAWKKQDPQIPKSVWYHTDAIFVGFRIVRPREIPDRRSGKILAIGGRYQRYPPALTAQL